MTRRQTPVSGQKLGRSHRERDRERHDTWDDERESFPQFWYVMTPVGTAIPRVGATPANMWCFLLHSMTCEKQFVPHDEKFLYCSDSYVHYPGVSAAGKRISMLTQALQVPPN